MTELEMVDKDEEGGLCASNRVVSVAVIAEALNNTRNYGKYPST
jgi:hypothetical protein